MEWIPIVGMLTSFGMVVLVVYFVTRARQRRVEIQAQVQAKLIDRFGSASELVEFLQSPAGKQFVSGVQLAPVAMARDRIHSGFTRAIVLTALGAGFLFLAFYEDNDFIIPAAILFSLGIGYVIATTLTYRLSRGAELPGTGEMTRS